MTKIIKPLLFGLTIIAIPVALASLVKGTRRLYNQYPEEFNELFEAISTQIDKHSYENSKKIENSYNDLSAYSFYNSNGSNNDPSYSSSNCDSDNSSSYDSSGGFD